VAIGIPTRSRFRLCKTLVPTLRFRNYCYVTYTRNRRWHLNQLSNLMTSYCLLGRCPIHPLAANVSYVGGQSSFWDTLLWAMRAEYRLIRCFVNNLAILLFDRYMN
jgi:hypothetical protein